MTKLTQYVCDTCDKGFAYEAELASITIALRNSVRVRESIHIHHEHICEECTGNLLATLRVDANGKRINPKIVGSRHIGLR